MVSVGLGGTGGGGEGGKLDCISSGNGTSAQDGGGHTGGGAGGNDKVDARAGGSGVIQVSYIYK